MLWTKKYPLKNDSQYLRNFFKYEWINTVGLWFLLDNNDYSNIRQNAWEHKISKIKYHSLHRMDITCVYLIEKFLIKINCIQGWPNLTSIGQLKHVFFKPMTKAGASINIRRLHQLRGTHRTTFTDYDCEGNWWAECFSQIPFVLNGTDATVEL